ncbi:hypothetical protein K439DRAFT_1611304 [Ramaria rubella]|nr:hypothetical protein K439DRAFT_1611304 [Ramaria rubella]
MWGRRQHPPHDLLPLLLLSPLSPLQFGVNTRDCSCAGRGWRQQSLWYGSRMAGGRVLQGSTGAVDGRVEPCGGAGGRGGMGCRELAHFALLADIQLQPTGASTCIPYQENFEHYLKYLTDGLLKKKASVIAIFHSWNQEFYPHTTPEMNNTGEADDESVQEALANLEADDEVEGSTGNVSDSGNERRNPGPNTQNQESTEHDPDIQEEDSLSHADERCGNELERESSSSLTNVNSNSAIPQSTGNYQTYVSKA